MPIAPPTNVPNKNIPMIITTLSIVFYGGIRGYPLNKRIWETKFSACYNIRHWSYVVIPMVGIRFTSRKRKDRKSSLLPMVSLISALCIHFFFRCDKVHTGEVFSIKDILLVTVSLSYHLFGLLCIFSLDFIST